jgi:hypothetical protein
MIVTTSDAEVKTFSLVLKDPVVTKCVLRDDSRNVYFLYDVEGVTEEEYYYSVEVDITYDLLNNRVYDFKLLNDEDEIIYYDRLFVTDIPANEFSVNKLPNGASIYVSHSSDNEYITYGQQ